jgi:uncharacterized protein
MTTGFVRCELRAVDVAAARAFYQQVLDEVTLDMTEISEMARARGARSLWLGHLAVADVRATVAELVTRGAVELPGGGVLRDPSGAMIGLVTAHEPGRPAVVWAQLFTGDPARAKRDYGELFGMTFGTSVEVPGHGTCAELGWSGGPPAGAISDITGKPHIHPHWLFFFGVRDLASAVASVEKNGGTVVARASLPDGRGCVVCDDPQGAAFALTSGATAPG